MSSNISYEEILSISRKVNIVDIIRDYVPLTQKGKNYFGICPFHDDHNPSMSVSSEKQMYKCFVCGNSGNVFNFIMEYEKVSFIEAVKIVADKIGIQLNINTKHNLKENVIDEKIKRLFDMYDISYKYYQNNLNTSYGKSAKKYLKNRNIDDKMIKQFNIGLSLNDSELYNILINKGYTEDEIISSGLAVKSGNNTYDLYKNRIMFPLYDLEGKVVGFSGRIFDVDVSNNKYVNTKETKIFKKGELLYNYHIAKDVARKEKSIIIVEGFMDVIRLSTIGITNVVATMGTAITKVQASLIQKLAPNIILMFDGDEAGNKATLSYIENFSNSSNNIRVVRLEDNLDPDEYILKNGKDKMLYHLSHTYSVYDYKLSFYKNNLDFNDSKNVSNYINVMLKEIEKLNDDILIDIELNKLSKTTNVDKEILKSKIAKKEDDIKNYIVKNNNIKITKYEKASKYILYRMIHDNNMINYYYNNLSYLPFELDRRLANEIVLFYKKFNSFNIDDFIIYLEDKKDLVNLIIDIDYQKYTKEELEDNIDNYFNVIRQYMFNNKQKELINKLKKETNEITRKELAKQIVDLKMKESM